MKHCTQRRGYLAAAFIATTLLYASAQTQSSTAAAGEAFRAGLAAVQTHDFAGAEKAFIRVVKLAPGVAAGHSALGAVLVQEGRPAQAVPELRTALKLDPHDASAELNLGLAVAATLDASAATTADTATLKQGIGALTAWQSQQGKPLPADAALALARLQLATGDGAAAQQTLAAAVDGNPQDATLLDGLGVLLAQQNKFAEAQQQFDRALAATAAGSPARAGIDLHLGAALLAQGNAAGALRVLQEAVQLRPADTASRVQLGAALFSAGQEEQALTTLRAAVQADSQNGSARYQLALTLESAGRSDEALPLFEQVRKARPQDTELLTNYGLALVQTGKAKEAVPLYLEGLKLSPKDATLHQDLGVAYLQQSDLDNALVEFRRGLELQPDSAQIAYDIGLALKLKDNLPDAIVALEKARTLDPTLVDAPYTLGVLYMQQGQFADSAKSLRAALQLREDNAEAWSMLGSVLKQDSKPQEAADALRRAIALDPGQPGNHVNLASVLVELGRKDEAVAERKTAAELSRAATTKQKERFALDSGNLLQQRGKFADAIVQFRSAVAAEPNDPAAHAALADALAQSGAKAEADAERAKAKALGAK